MACNTCKRCKQENVATPGLLQPLAILGQAWESVSMDFVEELPRSEGKDYILVVVDRFKKFAHFLSLSHPYTTQEVARVSLDQVVEIHETLRTIISDRDKVFTGLL